MSINRSFTAVVAAVCFFGGTAYAQVRLDGTIVDAQSGEDVPMAFVAYKSIADTTRTATTLTDFEGNYIIDNIHVGRWELTVSADGYQTLRDTVFLRMPSAGSAITRTDSLKVISYRLDEAGVTANRSTRTADKRTFTFSADQLAKSYDSYDLMKTLPGLREDMVNGGLKGLGGGSVLVLVNGIAYSDNEVKLIPKNKIKKVELYDIPPARYTGYSNVVNIVTSRLDDGVSLGVDLQHALTTGFGNDNAYFAWNFGKNRLTAEYSFNLRDYRNRTIDSEYSYTLGGTHYDLTYNEESKFGYMTHTPVVKYSYVDDDKTIFEISAKPNYTTRHDNTSGTGSYLVGEEDPREITALSNSKSKTFTPSVDAYLWKRISPKDELSLNAVGTLYNVRSTGLDNETFTDTAEPLYYDDRTLTNRKWSVIGEVAYTHDVLMSAKWNTGYRFSGSYLHSQADNEFGNLNYRSRFLTHRAYTELTGVWNNLLYRVSLGLEYTGNTSDGVRVKNLNFTPLVMLGYNLPHNNSLRLLYIRTSTPPDINDLSSNVSNIALNILSTGNPNLRNEVTQEGAIIYTFGHSYIDLTAAVAFQHKKDPLVEYYEEGATPSGDGLTYWFKRVNGSWEREYGAIAQVVIKPLGKSDLQISLYAAPTWESLHSDYLNYTLFSCRNALDISYTIKSFAFNYQYTIPVYTIEGSFRSLSENNHNFRASYKIKNWKISAGILFIGRPSHYDTISLPGMSVYSRNLVNIYDNRNMVTLGLSYHFSSGKKGSDYNRALTNSDTAAPTR